MRVIDVDEHRMAPDFMLVALTEQPWFMETVAGVGMQMSRFGKRKSIPRT
jgi:hypothetical protein